jgi:hypothetical protein
MGLKSKESPSLKLCIATPEGSDQSNVLGIGSTEHLSVMLLPTQVVVFDLSLILCSVVVVASVLWPRWPQLQPSNSVSSSALQTVKLLKVRRGHLVQVLEKGEHSGTLPVLLWTSA